MKKLVLLILLIASPLQAKDMIIGDSLCSTCCTVGSSASLYSKLYDYHEGRVWPTSLLCTTAWGSGGYWAAQARQWALMGESCNLASSSYGGRCFEAAKLAGCNRVVIASLLSNDLRVMHDTGTYPNEINSAIQYLKDVITLAQSKGMSVVYISGYPFSITSPQANGAVGDGSTPAASCSGTDVDTCTASRNQNMYYCLKQLEPWFAANDVKFIDFFSYRVTADTPDDAFATSYTTDGRHILEEEGLNIWYEYILDSLDNKVNVSCGTVLQNVKIR